MRKAVLSFVAIATASTGWACSGADGVGGGTGAGSQPTEILDASAPFEDALAPPGQAIADASPPEDATYLGTVDSSYGLPIEDASAPPFTQDSSWPGPIEDASAPPMTIEDASAPVTILDSSPGELDAEYCPAPPAGHSACWASCCTPAGAISSFTSASDVASAVLGRWRFCSAISTWQSLGPPDAVGVEFLAGGTLYFLFDGPAGPSRGAGFADAWSYDVVASGDSYQVALHPSADSSWSSSVLYSACPRELEFTSLGFGGPGLLVAVE
jgi:hypothetical protein